MASKKRIKNQKYENSFQILIANNIWNSIWNFDKIQTENRIHKFRLYSSSQVDLVSWIKGQNQTEMPAHYAQCRAAKQLLEKEACVDDQVSLLLMQVLVLVYYWLEGFHTSLLVSDYLRV